MPIDYSIDLELSAVMAEAKGVLCDQDLLDYAQRLFQDPESKLVAHELVDLSRADPFSEISPDGVRQVAEFWRAEYGSLSGGKLALVAPVDAAFGFARMYQLLRDDGPDHIKVFRDRASAREWLWQR